jgi:hypothetical protein
MTEQIISEALAYNSMRSVEEDLLKYGEENTIDSFQKTFLSNFHAVEVTLNGKTFPSVEHAYQRSKFIDLDLNNLSDEVKKDVEQYMKTRGYLQMTGSNVEDIFSGKLGGSAETKGVADVLRKHALERKDWDDVRVGIMADLLIQKFSQESFKQHLADTGDKLLVEGNDWNDTFWGFSNGRGKNLLGSLLMVIRKRSKKDYGSN